MFNTLLGTLRPHTAVPPVAAAPMEKQIIVTPLTARARLSFPNGLAYCGQVIQIVPWRKSLIVDSIRFEGASSDGQGFLKVSSMLAGEARCYIVPATRNCSAIDADGVCGSASIDLLADPGTAVIVTYFRGFSAGSRGLTNVTVSLAGRYAEL